MDTTTKMLVVAGANKEFLKAQYVLASIMSGNSNKKVQKIAKSLEFSFNNYWQENQWLRAYAGAKVITDKFVEDLQLAIIFELQEQE